MARSGYKDIIEAGLKVGDLHIYQEEKIWSRYSNDKVDIGEELAKVIRVLSKELPLAKPLRALSIGSSDEPQFRILETAFRGGLYLVDLDHEALDTVEERVRRQRTGHVTVIRCDYKKIFLAPKNAGSFVRYMLGGKKVDLITLHHSLYYCEDEQWQALFDNLYQYVLAPKGAIHVVLMDAESEDLHTTTWLYNHFVGEFFEKCNTQDLCRFKWTLRQDPVFRAAHIVSKTNHVRFFVDDFAKFMAVVWMVLLYPDVHHYSRRQRKEIAEFVYKEFWRKKRPLIQMQDHLVVYKGIRGKALL